MPKRYWLMKSEPDVFSFDDLKNSPDKTEHWDGVRNYQARNFMRDEMKVGDEVLFYHSNCKEPGVVGVAEVVKEAYPDYTAWDETSDYYDAKSSEENPRWFMVDICYKYGLKRTMTLQEMKEDARLVDMKVVQRGQRLSVQPVEKRDFDVVLALGGV